MRASRRQFWQKSLISGLMLSGALTLPAAGVSQEVTIRGTVVDGEGVPLAGATVSLAPVMDDYQGYELRLVEGLWAKPVASRTTSTDGRYEIYAAPHKRWRLIVESPERVTVTRRLEPLYVDRELPPAKLDPARSLTVRVTAGGVPVPGARVVAHGLASSPPGNWPQSWVAARTDVMGRAPLSVPPAGPWGIEVAAEGFVPVQLEHSEVEEIHIELAKGTQLDLRLLRAPGSPASSAVVFRPGTALTLARADADGRLTLHGEPGSRQLVRALAADDVALETEVKFPAPGERSAPQVLKLEQPTQLKVRVIEADSLAPAAEAVAWGRDDRVVYGNAKGYLVLTIPVTETAPSLTVIAPGKVLWHQRRLSAALAWDEPVTVALEPAVALRGQVVDSAGKPLANVSLRMTPEEVYRDPYRYRLFAEGRDGRSGADGRFAIPQLPPGVRYSLVARRAGFATTYSDLDPTQLASAPVEIKLAAGRRARGTVVDDGGRAVPGALVELVRMRRVVGKSRPVSRIETAAVTGPAGTFELLDLGPGRFDVRVSATGLVSQQLPGEWIAHEDTMVDLGSIRLQRGQRISGRVVDAENQPVAGAEVFLGSPGEISSSTRDPSRKTVSDRRGHFEFVGHAAGAYQVRARREGLLVAESPRLETPLAAPVVLVLRRGATLAGRVVDAQGQGVAGVSVTSELVSDAYGPARATTNASGDYELHGLQWTGHRLVFTASGFQTQRHTVEILPGVGRPLDVVLERGATVSGKVVGPDGRPASGLSVKVQPLDPHGSATYGRTDRLGRYEIAGVRPGRAAVVLWMHGDKDRQEIVVEPGLNRVSLALPTGVQVSGQVTDVEEVPVSGAQVSLHPSYHGARNPLAFTGVDGRFTLEGVVPGRYRLEVRHAEYVESTKTRFEVAAKPVMDLAARLRRGVGVSGRLEINTMSSVRVELNGRSRSYSASPDRQGRFRFEQVLPGSYTAAALSPRGVLARGEIEVRQESANELELVPTRGVELRGRVLQGGRAVAYAQVEVESKDGYAPRARTTAEGTFVLHGVPEGRLQLKIEASGHHHHRQVAVRDGREVLVELPTGEISGRIVEAESGKALAGVEVDLWALGASGHEEWRAVTYQDVTSDSLGTFVLRAVDPGQYRISVEHEGYGWMMSDLEVADAPLRDVDIRLSPSEGLIVWASMDDGSKVPLVDIALFDEAGRRVHQDHQQPGGDGKTYFRSAPVGDWQLWVKSHNSAWERLRVKIPGEMIPVGLIEGCSVSFTIPELGYDEFGRLFFELRDSEGRPLPNRLGKENAVQSFETTGYIDNLWPGEWTLTVRHPDGRAWSSTFVARVGKTAELELR